MTFRLEQLLAPVLSFTLLVGCRDGGPQSAGDDIPPPRPPVVQAQERPQAHVHLEDQVQDGDTVSVEYTGKLTNGTVFDSSVGRAPLTFTVGAGEMIKGFDSGVLGMKVGQSKTLTLPPDQAYGPQGRPPKIPPNATLIFEVKLVDLRKHSH